MFASSGPAHRPRDFFATLLLLALWLLPTQTILAENAETRAAVEQALLSMDTTRQDERWYFTMTVVEDKQKSIIRHNPLQEPLLQRTLVSVDGEAPSKKQLKEFQKKEAQRIEERDPEANFSYLVDLDTLQKVSLVENLAEIRFSPRIKRLEDFRDDFRGKLILNTHSNQIEQIEISSDSAFSPAFSVTLEDYHLSFSFREEQGTLLLDNMVSVASGKAGFFKKFQTETRVSFSGYSPAKAAAAIE